MTVALHGRNLPSRWQATGDTITGHLSLTGLSAGEHVAAVSFAVILRKDIIKIAFVDRKGNEVGNTRMLKDGSGF